ncbi:MAG: phosphotransferase family protein [Paracoccaceae bacterium]
MRDETDKVSLILKQFAATRDRSFPQRITISPILMPMQMAVDSTAVILISEEGKSGFFLKLNDPDMMDEIDPASSIAAARRAGETGIGPALVHADENEDALLFEVLGGYEPVRVSTASNPHLRKNILSRLREWHNQDVSASQVSPLTLASRRLAELGTLASEGDVGGLPDDFAMIAAWITRITSEMTARGHPSVPLHGENALSNFLCNENGDVKMVDYERGLLGDPMYDVGGIAGEFGVEAHEIDDIVRLYDSACTRSMVARAKLYLIIDDFLWGSWGRIQHCRAPHRPEIEFFKFGGYRLARCIHHLTHWPVDALLRSV